MQEKRLLMIGGWTDVYKTDKDCGFNITVAQARTDIKPPDLTIVDQLITSGRTDPLLLDVSEAIHRTRPFDAVVSFQEQGVMTAALIGQKLGIGANPLRPVTLTRDKGKMRAHMVEQGIPSIPFVIAHSAQEAIDFAEKEGWPIILKPVFGSGSQQIHKLSRADEVPHAFEQIRTHYPDAFPIAEQFMTGPEVSIEAISWDGKHSVLAVTDKITTGAPYFVETGHNMPSALPADTIDAIKSLTARFLDSIGHVHGPSHTEVIVSPKGPIIVESHTRTGGDRIFEMVEHVYGIDMFAHTFKGFAGQFPEVKPKAPSGAAIRFISLPEGKVTAIEGLADAKGLPGVVRLELNLAVGDEIKAFKHSNERYGYVLAIGADVPEAIENVNAALAALQVSVVPQ
jgi:biotin carboxylase